MSVSHAVFASIIPYLLISYGCCSNATHNNISISTRNNSLIRSQLNITGNSIPEFSDYNSSIISTENGIKFLRSDYVDCFGLGGAFASALHWFLGGSCTDDCSSLDVKFYMSSRRQPRRVEVLVGRQFGLEWTDFQIERRTVVIVHGFWSHTNEMWVKDLEKAFLLWGDVNVIVVDWSAGGSNTWNYYKAVVYTRIVGQRITRFLDQIANATRDNPDLKNKEWGPLHLVGHSLGAHICGFICHKLKRIQDKWIVKRVTGLDPAQPCFTTDDPAMKLDRADAEYVDVIHTNGRLLSRLGLGLLTPIGHADFYPNGGMRQPGCVVMDSGFFSFLPISNPKIKETICNHGRSYVYLTESLISAAHQNCTFWAHHWDMTYRGALTALSQRCTPNNCSEMGIRSENYPQRGLFYVATAEQAPFCLDHIAVDKSELIYLTEDLSEELDD